MRYAQVLAPLELDPIVVDDPWSAGAASMVFEGLYTYDYDLNLVPVLAASKPAVGDDGKTYTVELVEGATFQDGSRVTAEDVRYSFEPATYEAVRSPNVWQVSMIEGIATPDERTVEFTLKYPYPAFERVLTRGVVPKSVRRGSPETFGTEDPVGSGPYRPEIFKPGKYVVFSAWEDYWGPVQPAIETVKVVPNHAGLARSMSLRTNQNDIVERVHPKLWRVTEGMPNTRVVSTDSYHSHFVAFNCSDEPTSRPKVREAVDYLFSMDEFAKHVVGRAGRRQYSPLPRQLARAWDMPLEEWRAIPHRKNHEKARVLLEEAGVGSWSPNVAVPATKSSGDKMREKLAETIVHGLRELGFRKARVKTYPWRTFREKVLSGNADDYAMYVGSWPGYPDPDTFLYPLFHRDMEGLTNGTYYSNERVMRRIDAARKTDDRRERARSYEDAITTLLEDRVHLPAYTLANSFGVKDRVKGFEPHPLSQFNPRFVGPNGSVSLRE